MKVYKIANEPLRWLPSTNEMVLTSTYGISDDAGNEIGKLYKAGIHASTQWTFAYTDWEVQIGNDYQSFMNFKKAKKLAEEYRL